MSLSVESNVKDIVLKLRKSAAALGGEFSVSVENHVEYAAAVDQGSTREIHWATMPKKQRYAIIMAMKEREGQQRKTEAEVTRFDGGVRIVIPPAGIMANSFDPIKNFGTQILKALPSGFTNTSLQMAMATIGFGAQSILVDNTPVDQGVLIKGWEVKL